MPWGRGDGGGVVAVRESGGGSVSRWETTAAGLGRAGELGRQLGFGPIGALGIFFRYSTEQKNRRKLNKNPKMPKQILAI